MDGGVSMDGQRFDNLARALAARLSRRRALRGAGAAASVSLLAAAGARAAPVAALAQGGQPVYTMIRRYTLDGQQQVVRQALMQGYVEDACRAPGFIAYFAVEEDDGAFATVAVFSDQQGFDTFANAEANWIAQNLSDLLPAPDEAISGQTFIHVGNPQGFSNTCAAPPAPTAAPAAPTAAAPATGPAPTSGPAPTAAPTAVPPTAQPSPPACTAQGCVCTTGTQNPCDSGLVCCPTTVAIGGPGVCQTDAVCYPNGCTSDGGACDTTCTWGDACPNCCSTFCNSAGQCDEVPPCTGEGCTCTTGTQSPCDSGLVCCGTTGTPGGPGTCMTDAECNSNQCWANGQACISSCSPTAPCPACCSSYCNENGVCDTDPPPCTGGGCSCTPGASGACDSGLVCCPGTSSAGPTCSTAADCASIPCSGQYCYCQGGVEGACGDGLVCCVQGADPGGDGSCQAPADCPGSGCTGENCACDSTNPASCDQGLVCCPPLGPGSGTCLTEAECAPPPCIDNGTGCDSTCNWGDSCPGCCSGFCNTSGVCDGFTPSDTCISDGVNCGTTCNWSDSCDACCSGFCDGAGNCNEPGASAGACGDQGCGCELGNPACDDGLLCCDDGSGVTGTCQTGC
jgi:hypothetical protein